MAENRTLKKKLRAAQKTLDMRGSSHTIEVVDTLTEWRRKGGKTRSERLSPAERSASARKAALARWEKARSERKESDGAR